MCDVLASSGEEIVETEHIVAIRQQALAQMRTNESCAASDKYSQGISKERESATANIGKQVFGVNKRSRKTKISKLPLYSACRVLV